MTFHIFKHRPSLLVVFVALLFPVGVFAETYSTSVKLKHPRKLSKRAEGKADEVLMKIWIPDGVKVIKGAVYNPFYLKAVTQKHWQAACRHWNFAILASNHFNVKKEDMANSVVNGLKQFAEESKHPELANIPLCMVGMSAGAGMSVNIASQIPDRVLAVGPVCLEVGPRNPESYAIPMITVFGEKDGKQLEKLAQRLPEARQGGAQFATAVQWRRRHEFGRANNILVPLFDHVIKQRYPSEQSPKNGPIKLIDLNPQNGWLGNPHSWDQPQPEIAAYTKYKGDKTKACWFPDQFVASVWQSFVVASPPIRITSPAGMGDGNPFQVYQAGKDIDVTVSLKKGLGVEKLELMDGNRLLAKVNDQRASISNPQPGIYALIVAATLSDGSRILSHPNTIIVSK